MRADITVGSAFPDYELPDHTGTPRRLSELQGEDPIIIVLAREAYSAKDQRQQEGLAELWREMKPGVGYCQLVTITTSDPQETFNYRSGVGAEWPFLADPDRIVQRDLDIAEYTDPIHDQMVPHTIVCEPGLIVYKIYNGYWFFGRPTLEELRQDLRAVLMKHHWDWDLSDPEVRAACSGARLTASTRRSSAGPTTSDLEDEDDASPGCILVWGSQLAGAKSVRSRRSVVQTRAGVWSPSC
jgi:peroxiredoxin